jgi:hypothetical protein
MAGKAAPVRGSRVTSYESCAAATGAGGRTAAARAKFSRQHEYRFILTTTSNT